MSTRKGESFKDTEEKGYPDELPEPFVRALNEIEKVKLATEPLIKEHKVLGKPLTQILDEMDENIRAAAEAARKSEEAARAAKEAASAATQASGEAEKRAEEALLSAMKAAKTATKEANKVISQFKKTKQNMQMSKKSVSHWIKSLEKRLDQIEAKLPSEKIILLREISKKEAEKEIRDLFFKGKILYYSDIAERLNLDLQLVVEICNKLQKNGEIKISDNLIQKR